ncbi:Helicase superfamily 1/2, ATP-binding domain,Helicase, C-terminal,P-loop containing nucleoside [Cinara cedri]|uniref:RNA helicase n=1 Tax=Cinara cedri TaxID=506608 RepID=A0A5E4M7K2_9HEMI|nr:Helicase superfamily 1/2, ATP-binding domain,Helicase, C-terminal,P-loop containing nucleoside [Cinara cedri]
MEESFQNNSKFMNGGHGRDFIRQSILQMKKENELNYSSNVNTLGVLPPKSTYIPKQISDADDSIYETRIDSSINLNKFDEAKVNVVSIEVLEKIENFDFISIKLKINIEKCKFKKPTPIQKYTIPAILSGKDLLAAAQNGSGKTVAYVLPILHILIEKPHQLFIDSVHCEPQVLIVTPTRELAVQIHTVVMLLARGTGISSLICHGGSSVKYQKKKCLQGCHILVGTPGRLNYFLQGDVIAFKSIRFVVLDEVDKILNFDSKYEVDRIINHISMISPKHRQTIMLSATLPNVIQNLAADYLNTNYVFVSVGILNGVSQNITQQFYQVTNSRKRYLLKKILSKGNKGTMVFVNKSWTADFLATFLSEKNISATSIHIDRPQMYRELALNDFVSGKYNVIVTTGVASRGLDIKIIQQVINYDMPGEIESYIHRIGRTGRMGNSGKAISFININYDYHLIEPIIKTLSASKQEIPEWLQLLGENIRDKSSGEDDRSTDLNTNIRRNVNLGLHAVEEW